MGDAFDNWLKERPPEAEVDDGRLLPGTVIGAYRIESFLGKGGMGCVYEAEHIRLGVKRALKVFSGESVHHELLRKRFVAEGRMLADLSHPRIVRVYDFAIDETTGNPYFAMDFVVSPTGRPQTLESACGEGADEDRVAGWFRDICEGLTYIHLKGVVHRDISLDNILLDRDGHAVITDFGIARITGEEYRRKINVTMTMPLPTGEKFLWGKGLYMSPELKAGGEATSASDAYALGVLLFRLLSGSWYTSDTRLEDALAGVKKYNWVEVIGILCGENPSGMRIDALNLMPVSESHYPPGAGGVFGEYAIESYLQCSSRPDLYCAIAVRRISGERCVLQMERRPSGKKRYGQIGAINAMFQSETNLLTCISHPNVAKVYGRGVEYETGAYFVASEFIEGPNGEQRTLRQELEDGVGEDRVVALVSDICDGLSALAALSAIHDDIGMEHIFINRDGRAVVAGYWDVPRGMNSVDEFLEEFGVLPIPFAVGPAVEAEIFGVKAARRSEPSRFPPECGPSRQRRKTFAAESWMLGRMLYEILSGFVSCEVMSDDSYDFRLCENCKYQWDSVLRLLFAKNPLDRPQNGFDIVKALLKPRRRFWRSPQGVVVRFHKDNADCSQEEIVSALCEERQLDTVCSQSDDWESRETKIMKRPNGLFRGRKV